MLTRTRILVLAITLMMILSACAGGAFGGIGSVTEAIDSQDVVRELQWFERGELGQLYEVSLTVPEDWVDTFQTVNNGAVLTFNRLDDNGNAFPVFSIHTLSFDQQWEQGGSYPGDYRNIYNDPETMTYFYFHAPAEAFYSRLTSDDYDALLAVVADVMTTFEAVPIGGMGATLDMD
ncbi:MAG: hypothetical protein AAF846_16830 [Chloroflexota bacterium]